MKKYIVSSVVIISFIAYSFYQRAFGSQSVQVVMPKNNNAATPTLTVTSTPISTAIPTIEELTPLSEQTTNTPTPTPKANSPYKDGAYTGDAADAFYGLIQVKITIANGKLTDVQFLQAPNDRGTSIEINRQADPILAQEAIQAQSAQVDIVSGATDSSQAFVQSLQSALDQAKN